MTRAKKNPVRGEGHPIPMCEEAGMTGKNQTRVDTGGSGLEGHSHGGKCGKGGGGVDGDSKERSQQDS